MIEIGRVIVKTAGRDSGKKGVIIDIVNDNYVIVDGQIRRRRCNAYHIEPLDQKVNVGRNASHDEVVKELKRIGILVKEKSGKKKAAKEKPVKRKSAAKVAKEKEGAKKGK